VSWPAWLAVPFARRRARRATLQRRIVEAESAAREANARWPQVERAADEANAFVLDMRRAMRRRPEARP
jgi:hypothetical protein